MHALAHAQTKTASRPPTGLGRFTLFAVALIVGLIAYGSWVRVSGSGLGCPDWPLCNGQVQPTDRASLIESGHRWYAGATMLAVFGAAAMGLRRRREYPRSAGLLAASAVLIVLQALLGAAVVLTELHSMVRLVHLSLAMALLATLTITGIALLQGREPSFSLRGAPRLLIPAAVVLVLLGGTIVATGSSAACKGLPLCDGSSSTLATGLHSAHRTLGVLTLFGAALLAFRDWRAGGRDGRFRAALAATLLLLSQVAVGVSTVLLTLPPPLRVLHLGIAAAAWTALVAVWALSAKPPAATAPVSRRARGGRSARRRAERAKRR
jgi:heme A synthase